MKSARSVVRSANEDGMLRTFSEEMPAGVCIIQDGTFCYVNSAFPIAVGYTADELIGKDALDFVVPQHRRMVRENTIRMLKGKLLSPYQFRVTCKDGTIVWVMAAVKSVRYRGRPAILGNYMEVTGRMQLEENLEESEHKYRLLFETSPDCIAQLDREGRHLAANPAVARSLGIPLEEVIGKTLFEVTPQEIAQRRLANVRKVLDEWQAQVFEDERAGRHFHHVVVPAKTSGKEVVYVITMDVTERRQIEEALRQSEERYRTILEEMEDSYFEVDVGGHFAFFNSAVCRNLGYSREELVGMSYKKITAVDDAQSVYEVFNKVYKTGIPNKGFPWRVIHKDGTRGFVEASVSPLRNEKGQIIGFRGVGRDVTDRRTMEVALRQSEEKYRALFDSTVTGTVVVDIEALRVVMANQAAAKTLGFSSTEEVIGANPLDFFSPEDREKVRELMSKGLVEQDLRRALELRVVTRGGREMWVSVTGVRIVHEGRLAGLVSFIDITEQKRQNERLMLTERLACVGELAAGAAHELNNPLTSIIGFSQLLMQKELPDDIREDLRLINSQAQRAASVTNNLLTFARKQAPVKRLSQMNGIIEDVLKLRAYEHKVNGIEIQTHLAPDLPEIMVDHFQMQQVCMNIIINAEYFMIKAHDKGVLNITTRKQNDAVVISFADDGPGIPPENVRRIFDPFFTTKEAGKGTGLGLSICHGIVTEHGGHIYAVSRPGKGATIIVELPTYVSRPQITCTEGQVSGDRKVS